MSVKTVQQQVECIVSELEAILPHFKTSTVSYAKQKLEKVIAKLKMKPHPEPNSYFIGQKRVSEPYTVFCGRCLSYGCAHAKLHNDWMKYE